MIFSECNKEIAQALTKALSEFENPKHNTSVTVRTKQGGQYTFDYTDLGGIFDEVKSILKENGLTIMQNAYTETYEGQNLIAVQTMLLHESGEWVKSNPLKMTAQTNIQDVGGQVTYLKRYSLSALLGIATESDDDANGASGNSYQFNSRQASDKQLNYINKLLKDKETEEHPIKTLYEGLKKRMKTDKEMESWSANQASQAIKILQGDGK